MTNKFKSKGQMILVILLVMAVGLTVGLSVASRSVTDVSFSTKIEDSSRAFSAAETGIEEALRQGIYIAPTRIPGPTAVPGSSAATYNVDLNPYGNLRNYPFPGVIKEGDGQTVWLTSFDPATGLPQTAQAAPTGYPINKWFEICWSKADPNSSIIPALDVSLFYLDAGNPDLKVIRVAYDYDNLRTSGPNPNGFTSAGVLLNNSCGTSGIYDYHVNLIAYCGPPGTCVGGINPSPTPIDPTIPRNINSRYVAMRIKPVYADIRLALRGDCVAPCILNGAGEVRFPEQGKNITSSGQTTSGVTRKWNVIQTYSSAPDIFDYAVWSNKDLTR